MKIDSCVYQTHPELSCYHEIQGPVETSFSIGNSSQLSWNFRHKIQLGWVEFLLKMMFQLVPVSRGNRPRKTITSVKQEKRRVANSKVRGLFCYFGTPFDNDVFYTFKRLIFNKMFLKCNPHLHAESVILEPIQGRINILSLSTQPYLSTFK